MCVRHELQARASGAQYPEGKAPTVNITPKILNRYLNDIEKDLSQQPIGKKIVERTYHYNLVPPEFAQQASNTKNKIYLSFYPKSCDFTLHLLYSYFLKEHDVVVESLVIYYLQSSMERLQILGEMKQDKINQLHWYC